MSLATHPLHTPLCDVLDCRYPILLAGMGGVARHQLATAVSQAGGFGVLGMVREPVGRIESEVAAFRHANGGRAFAVNLIPAATGSQLLKDQVACCLRLNIPFISLFWTVDQALVRHLKAEGVRVIHQVGNQQDAEQAIEAGADILIAQGYEAGGHVRGAVGTLSLLSALVEQSPVPVVAAGGIGSGRTLLAALMAGAQGVSLGSALLATHEANAHEHHKQRLVQARADDTVYTRRFRINWPEAAPVRVLPNAVTRGSYDQLRSADSLDVIGHQDGQPVLLFSTDSPLADATGNVDDMALYAGQSCGQIHSVIPAGERIASLISEASGILNQWRSTVADKPLYSSPCSMADMDPAWFGFTADGKPLPGNQNSPSNSERARSIPDRQTDPKEEP